MLSLSLFDIAKETGARFSGENAVITAVSTDTRDLPQGCLFVALMGDSFDGHDFIPQALENGASYAVSMKGQKEYGEKYRDKIIPVNNTRDALMSIARLRRKALPAKIVAVTGSVGKTTTKEMIACVCGSIYNTAKTEKNLNNEIGLSKTILGLDDSCEAAILEMGSDGPGQIVKLSNTALPDIGVVTSIGVSHIEAFGTRESILAEKMNICAGMASGSSLILCGDNDLLETVYKPELKTIRYAIKNRDCPILADSIKERSTHTDFEILYNGSRFGAQIPCPGRHNVLNALAAFCVGICLGIPPDTASAALKKYRPSGMRQNIVVHNSFTVVEDCYNASPDSMRAAFETLGKMETNGRRIAVLSDMLELGPDAERFHFEAGIHAAECKTDCLLATGELSRQYVAGAKSGGITSAAHYSTKDGLFDALRTLIKPGDLVWFKASRGMKLEEIIEKVYTL